MKKSVFIPLITVLVCCLFVYLALPARNIEKQAWKQAERVLKNIKDPTFPDRVLNILDFGAVVDIEDYSSTAINQAILKCHEQGGGKVLVPCRRFLHRPH